LKAGTPFEIASTPVSAVAPCENALRIANNPTVPATVAASGNSSDSTPTGGQPVRHLASPTATNNMIEITNPYVGMAKSVPDSRAPRRFANVTSTTKKIDSATRCSFAQANAEPIANTPATIETTTVIM
jgi:hypothetical protein